jgi:hypothetical protein
VAASHTGLRVDQCGATPALTALGLWERSRAEMAATAEFEVDPECETVCTEFGLCEVVDGTCAAAIDAHCRQSAMCLHSGQCFVDDNNWCNARLNSDCAATEVCEILDECVASGGVCTVAVDSDADRMDQTNSYERCPTLARRDSSGPRFTDPTTRLCLPAPKPRSPARMRALGLLR